MKIRWKYEYGQLFHRLFASLAVFLAFVFLHFVSVFCYVVFVVLVAQGIEPGASSMNDRTVLPYLGMLLFAACPSRVLVLQRLSHLHIEYHRAVQSACDILVQWYHFPGPSSCSEAYCFLVWVIFAPLLFTSFYVFHGVSGCLSSLCLKEHYAFSPCSWSDHTFGFSLIIHYMASPFHLQKALPCFSSLDCWCCGQLCRSQPRSFFSQLP